MTPFFANDHGGALAGFAGEANPPGRTKGKDRPLPGPNYVGPAYGRFDRQSRVFDTRADDAHDVELRLGQSHSRITSVVGTTHQPGTGRWSLKYQYGPGIACL